MIKPTIGRVVWFRHKDALPFHQPFAAIISYVHTDEYVNLVVFNPDGKPFGGETIRLIQEGEQAPENKSYCEWMPYQIGQAKANPVTA